MDALSEVLRALRLTSGFFLEAESTAPWCIDSAPARDDVRQILPSAEHVAIYHLLIEGRCRASLPERRQPDGGLLHIHLGGGGEPARSVCGLLACDAHVSRPLLSALPRLLRVELKDRERA